MTDFINDGPVPGESLTSGIRQLPYDRPPAMVDNAQIAERLWNRLSEPKKLRELNAILEIGVPVDELSAQIAHGLFREGQIAPQNAVMVLPSLTVMLIRIAEAFKTKYRISSDDKHSGVSEAEVLAAVKKAEKSSPEMNNKEARGFKAAALSSSELTKNANNVGFLQAAKDKI